MVFEWVFANTGIIITLVVAPLLAWLFYERHVQKHNLKKMKKDLEVTDVSIEQSKWEVMQKQIDTYSNLISNIRTHSEEVTKIYERDYQRLKDKMEEMRAEHERERALLMKEIDNLTEYIEKLKTELDSLR